MQQSEQIKVGEQIFEYIDDSTTALAEQIYKQPVSEYTSEAVSQKECSILFQKTPLCVGLSNLLPKKNTYFTHDLSQQPLLLTRDESGKFHAFLNVCRHRGARVAESCGKRKYFNCPYHSWKYDLKGSLINRPEEISFEHSPKSDHHLVELEATELDGLLWVMPAPGVSLAIKSHMSTINDDLKHFDLGNFYHHESRSLTKRMNWKLVMDTFMESYHFCVLHKESICNIFYHNLGTFDPAGDHFRLVFARHSIDELRNLPKTEWNILPHIVSIYILFPNVVLVWQLDHIELWQIFPGKDPVNETVMQVSLYTPDECCDEKSKQHWDKNLELVLHVTENEDFPVGEGTQKGFYTGAQNNITFGLNEPALAKFHSTITDKINGYRK